MPRDISAETDAFRQVTSKDKDTDRKTKALLNYAQTSKRNISENFWVPDPLFFAEFAADTLLVVNVQVKDLTAGYEYLRVVLNDHQKFCRHWAAWAVTM